MIKLALKIFLIASLVLSTQIPSFAAISDWQRGFTIRLIDQSFSEVDATLNDLKALGVNYVTITPGWITDSRTSSNVDRKDRTPTDQLLIYTIDKAHSLGMHVMLKPHLDIKSGLWRANLNPANLNKFFQNYSKMILHYANICQQHDVELFSIGAELVLLTQNTSNLPKWNSLIDNVRAIYKGKLTYSANADVGGYNETRLPFANKLDYFGISMYRPVSNTNEPTVESMIKAWAGIDKTYVSQVIQDYGKPVIFTEIGYRSVDGASVRPWDYSSTPTVDQQEQADLYKAFFEYWKGKQYFYGVHFWDWSVEPNAGGPTDKSFNIQNKLAEETARYYFNSADSTVDTTANTSLFKNLAFATDSLEKSKLVYSDRTYVFTDVPAEIYGAEYVLGLNSDKSVTIQNYLTFDASQDLTLMVAYDARATSLPDWLKNWNLTNLLIKTNDTNFKVYTKEYPAGQIILGGNKAAPASGAGSNYIVIASTTYIAPPIVTAPIPTNDQTLPITDAQYQITVSNPQDGAEISGEKKIKARIENLSPDEYDIILSSNFTGNILMENGTDGLYKQVKMDFDSWGAYGRGPHQVTLTAKDKQGKLLDSKIVTFEVKL